MEKEDKNEITMHNEKIINGKPTSYKTGDVAALLNESTAMIRVYCNEFEEFLNLEHTQGGHRIFTEESIKTLTYIIYLCKEEHYTMKQAKEYLSTPEGKLMQPLQHESDKTKVLLEVLNQQMEEIIKKEVASVLQTLVPTLQDLSFSQKAIDEKINDIQHNTLNTSNAVNTLQEDSTAVKNNLLELNKNSRDISSSINEIHIKSEERTKKVDDLLATVREHSVENTQEKKKSFLAKIFNK